MILEGSLSVKAAMLAQHRQIDCIYIDVAKHSKDIHFIECKAKELGIPIVKKSREEIDTLATGATHGGIIAQAQPRKYQKISDCFGLEDTFIAVIEGVEDPFNLGYIIRSLYSSGCDGIILHQRNWTAVESIILKSSAGAFEYMNIVMSEDIEKEIIFCKERGLICYAAMRKDAIPYFDANFKQSILIAIGGEMRGLSRTVLNHAQQNIYIPYARDFRAALNAAGAAAALGFEVMRQRNFGK